MNEHDARIAIVETCLRLEAKRLVAGASGNVSVRLPSDNGEERFGITPSGIRYRTLQPQAITIIDVRGDPVLGQGAPSSERAVHLAVYAARPDVGAVIHTHSIYASALAVAGAEIPPIIDEQVATLGGAVSVANYAPPGSQELARGAVSALADRQAVLLRNHGALGAGRDLDEAFDVVELVERVAHIYLLAQTFGTVQPLASSTVAEDTQ